MSQSRSFSITRKYFLPVIILSLATVIVVFVYVVVENSRNNLTYLWQYEAIQGSTQELCKYDQNCQRIKSRGNQSNKLRIKPTPHEWLYEVIRNDSKWKSCTPKFCEFDHNCRTIKSRGNQSCCQEHIVKILSEVKDLFQSYNLTYWITYGLLLGAVREQDFIAWENDIDVQIDDTAKEFLFPGSKNENVALLFSKLSLPYVIKFFWSDIGRGCIIYKDQQQFPLGRRLGKTPYIDIYPCSRH